MVALLAALLLGTSVQNISAANAMQTFSPTVIPLSAPEISNPYRGQYLWHDSPSDPAGRPAIDSYARYNWNVLETGNGSYNFDDIEKRLSEAQARGGTFAFRIMASCPECGENVSPSYVPKNDIGDPDWNSEDFLGGYERIIAALSQRYANDPRLGYLDIGGYGNWGEWHLWQRGGTPITDANALRLIKSVATAFPNKHLVLNVQTPAWNLESFKMSPKMGLRIDCIGAPNTSSPMPDAPELHDRWKTALVVGEWCNFDLSWAAGLQQAQQYHFSMQSSGNYSPRFSSLSAADQAAFEEAHKVSGYRLAPKAVSVPSVIPSNGAFPVTIDWENLGNAPVYDTWNTNLALLDSAGRIVNVSKLDIDLRQILPGAFRHQVNAAFANVAPGSYTLGLAVEDPAAYFQPMNLSIEGRNANGIYALGTVNVGAESSAPPLPGQTPADPQVQANANTATGTVPSTPTTSPSTGSPGTGSPSTGSSSTTGGVVSSPSTPPASVPSTATSPPTAPTAATLNATYDAQRHVIIAQASGFAPNTQGTLSVQFGSETAVTTPTLASDGTLTTEIAIPTGFSGTAWLALRGKPFR